MKDINNALLHIKAKHNGEIPYQYGSRECAKLMDSYAKEYHQAKLKLLGISDVAGQSEQLVCDCKNCKPLPNHAAGFRRNKTCIKDKAK